MNAAALDVRWGAVRTLSLLAFAVIAACGSFGAEEAQTPAASDAGAPTGSPDAGSSSGGSSSSSGGGPVTGYSADVAMGYSDDHAIKGQPVHVCRMRAGSVRCWGNNELGEAPSDTSGITDVVQLTAGSDHTCARVKDGTLRCWGFNYHGQLGVNQNEGTLLATPSSTPPIANAITITAGYAHTCTVAGSKASCWGKHNDGERGEDNALNTTLSDHQPAEIAAAAIAVAAGYKLTCYLDASGSAWCSGGNQNGQVGQTSPLAFIYGFKQVPTITKASQIVAGRRAACAIASDELWCWGEGSSFGIAAGPQPTPTRVGGEDRYAAVALGVNVCGLRVDRKTVDCFVGGSRVTKLFDEEIANVATASLTYCAIAKSGALRCWGDLSMFQLTSTPEPQVIEN